MRPTDHRDIFVRLHPFFYKKKRFTPLYIYIPGLMTSFLSDQSQRLWSAHTNPLPLPSFELTNQSAPFSHVIFALDQSERSIFPTANQKPDRKVSLWCAYHYCFLNAIQTRLGSNQLTQI